MKPLPILSLLFVFSAALSSAAEPDFQPQSIDDAISIGYGLAIADVDGDGKDDILLCDQREIVWYQNPTWEKRTIIAGLSIRDNVCIAASDLDGDGMCEIAVGSNWNPGETNSDKESGAVFYLNPPEDRMAEGARWDKVQLPHEPTVHRMHWREDELLVLPLHGRGNVGGEGRNGTNILSYQKPRHAGAVSDPSAWDITILPGSLHKTHNFDLTQHSYLGNVVAVGGAEGLFLIDAKAGTGTFAIEPDQGGEGFGGIGEVRGGPRYTRRGNDIAAYTTIEPMHGNSVVVYEQLSEEPAGGGTPRPTWKRTVLDDSLAQGHAIACADLLGTGREQVVAGWRKANGYSAVGINLYAWREADDTWTTHPIDRNTMACEDLKLADLDADGRPDIIACGRATKNVIIYWNRSEIAEAPALESNWTKHLVWEGKGGIPSAVPRDYDGDGHMDIIFGAGDGDHLLSGPEFGEDLIIRPARPGQLSRGIHNCAMDIDRDGDIDFVAGARGVYWLENPGGTAGRAAGSWKYREGDTEISGVHDVLPADVDGDGLGDLLANEFKDSGPVPNSLTWMELGKADDGTTSLTRHAFALGDAPGGNHYMGFGDLDGDGLPDITAGTKGHPFAGGNWFAWWKNPGPDGLREPWEKHPIRSGQMGATIAIPSDLDGDGDLDLLAARGHGSGVLWFENLDGTPDDEDGWATHEIDPRLSRPHCLVVADLDGDGDPDAATCARHDRRTVWYENDGKGGFTPHDLDDDQAAYDIHAADMDGDGDLDLLVAGHGDSNVVWYENRMGE